MIVSPSLLAANFNELDCEIAKVNASSCEFLHLDVMDGRFVPNTTFDEKLIKELRNKTDKVFDVHLMIENPEAHIDKYFESGADIVTYHLEACQSNHEVIKKYKDQKKKIGLSIKPGTPVAALDDYLADLDLILVMSVEPGFGGQKFIPSCLEKIAYLKDQKNKNGYHYIIEVDGGINDENASLVFEAGCDALVAGTYLFKSDDFVQRVKRLQNL